MKTFTSRHYVLSSEIDTRDEFEANLRLPRHDRIVPLLAAFQHRQKFHLIFPYAEGGDLKELWKTYSSSESTGNNPATWYSTEWLLNECLGIAEGLAAMHRPTINEKHGARYKPVPQIHTDIKARNILCFNKTKDGKQSFTLKLADFGFTRKVDEDLTLAVVNVVHVKTYRPPEYDLDDIVYLNFDVWSLGCLYIDFITWAVLGWSGLEEFECYRKQETDGTRTLSTGRGLTEDTFFRKVALRSRWYKPLGLYFRAGRVTEKINKKNTMSQRVLTISRRNNKVSCTLKDSVLEVSGHAPLLRLIRKLTLHTAN